MDEIEITLPSPEAWRERYWADVRSARPHHPKKPYAVAVALSEYGLTDTRSQPTRYHFLGWLKCQPAGTLLHTHDLSAREQSVLVDMLWTPWGHDVGFDYVVATLLERWRTTEQMQL